jgi:hypothetical protein
LVVSSAIPGDVVASVSGAIVVGLFYLARQIARLSERVARLEGEQNAKRREAVQ